MPADRRPSRPCAQCGAALQHVPRQTGGATATASPAPRGHRRYRCPQSSCAWEGWLPRRSRAAVGSVLRRRRAALRRRWLLPVLTALSVTAGAAALGVVAFRVLVAQPSPLVVPRQAWAPGEFDDGRPLPVAHPLRRYVALQLQAQTAAESAAESVAETAAQPAPQPNPPWRAEPTSAAVSTPPSAPGWAAPVPVPVSAGGLKDWLTYRHGCVWGQPGRNPYRGTVEQALKASALPPEVVQKIAHQVRLGSRTDRVEISNAGIRAARSGRVFDASHFAMSYGMTLCTSTRVNFVAGHVEQASLFEASDDQGRVYAVMVPDVCGNVSVLADAEDRRRVTSVAGSSDDAPAEARAEQADAPGALVDNRPRRMPTEIDWKEPGSAAQNARASRTDTQTVPEPGTLACALLALAVMAGLARRRRSSKS